MTPPGRAARIAQRTWPGEGATVLAVHATGFCKDVWAPVVEEMRARGVANPVVAIDQPGHGDTAAPAGLPFDWWELGSAVQAVAEPLRPIGLGIGHSSGGAALIMAEVTAPGLFEALLLVEPIVFPPPYRRGEDMALATMAERRRASFGSRAEALDNFRGKGPFAGWDPRALEAYIDGCLGPRDGRWALKCQPEVEAEFYRAAGAHGAWERLPEVGARVAVVAGEHSDSHPAPFVARQAARLGAATVTVDGASHLVPMERPGVVAALIGEMLAGGVETGHR